MKNIVIAAAAAAALTGAASASVVQVTEGNFQAGAGLITFSEFGLNTVNPTYNPVDYGGDASSPVVTFDGSSPDSRCRQTPASTARALPPRPVSSARRPAR